MIDRRSISLMFGVFLLGAYFAVEGCLLKFIANEQDTCFL